MKKGLVFLFAALLVVGLPLSALAGTEVYRVTDQSLSDIMYGQTCFSYDPNVPNLASAFADSLQFGETICLEYVNAFYSETVRVKTNKDLSKDIGWNLVGHGTVRITKGNTVPGDGNVAAASFMRMFVASSPQTGSVLYEGPVQVEQVVQDDGNDAGCTVDGTVPSEGTSLEYFKCGGTTALDYVMYHWKLTGNKIAFNKITIKNGVFYWRDEINGWENSMSMEY